MIRVPKASWERLGAVKSYFFDMSRKVWMPADAVQPFQAILFEQDLYGLKQFLSFSVC